MTPGAAIARFKNWFVDDALPLWAARGYDAKRGGFYESLDFNGEPVTDQPRRVRVQARQIYTFSEAAARGAHRRAEALAAEGFEHFLARACPEGGARGCVHLLSDDGSVLDGRRDLYDQAFLLLACAARWRAAKDDRALDLANRTMAFLDRELASPHGGWRESDRGELPRRQNPHMHLFEAFMTLYDATGDRAFRDAAAKTFLLFERFFYDAASGALREFFSDDWKPDAGGQIQPGHMMEWVWLLSRHDAVHGADTSDIRRRLYARAKTLGADQSGFLFDAVGPEAPARRNPGARRLWPQTEYVRAALVLARRGEETAAAEAGALIDRLFEAYLRQKTPGLWCDQYDGEGRAAAKDVPASILYHLFGAAAEAEAYLAARNP